MNTSHYAGIDLTPEFLLVVACCRWSRTAEWNARIANATSEVDWDILHLVAKRHRVEALVWDGLRHAGISVPDEVDLKLSGAAGAIARQNLASAAESLRLKRLFASAEVPLLFLKGVTLAMRAYGSLSLKMGWDIDVLVPNSDLERAAAALTHAGYRMVIPEQNGLANQLQNWNRRSKESVWLNEDRRCHIELHTRLVDNPLLLSSLRPFSVSHEVEVARGVLLPTLQNDELFAYLCVHGASSAWFRLKWLADIHALIGLLPPVEIDRLYERSQQLGAGRAAAQALMLCERLFGLYISRSLHDALHSDGVAQFLVRGALRSMAGRGTAVELDELRFGTAYIHLSQFGLMPGWRFKLAEARHQLDALRLSLSR